jgi:hypothetical protein
MLVSSIRVGLVLAAPCVSLAKRRRQRGAAGRTGMRRDMVAATAILDQIMSLHAGIHATATFIEGVAQMLDFVVGRRHALSSGGYTPGDLRLTLFNSDEVRDGQTAATPREASPIAVMMLSSKDATEPRRHPYRSDRQRGASL